MKKDIQLTKVFFAASLHSGMQARDNLIDKQDAFALGASLAANVVFSANSGFGLEGSAIGAQSGGLVSFDTDDISTASVPFDFPGNLNAVHVLGSNNYLVSYHSEVTINGFTSPSWSIRNSSALLFGTLVPRMLGESLSQAQGNQQKSTSVDVFFHRYPKLLEYFLICLEKQTLHVQNVGANAILPHVEPGLTFLSKLKITDSEFSKW